MGRGRAQRETSAGGVVFRRAPGGEVHYLIIRDSYENWGFPKGHLEPGEPALDAARREVAEETGLQALEPRGALDCIDWYFRFRGRTIHKYCHFFLFESASGEPVPQTDEDRAIGRSDQGDERRPEPDEVDTSLVNEDTGYGVPKGPPGLHVED